MSTFLEGTRDPREFNLFSWTSFRTCISSITHVPRWNVVCWRCPNFRNSLAVICIPILAFLGFFLCSKLKLPLPSCVVGSDRRILRFPQESCIFHSDECLGQSPSLCSKEGFLVRRSNFVKWLSRVVLSNLIAKRVWQRFFLINLFPFVGLLLHRKILRYVFWSLGKLPSIVVIDSWCKIDETWIDGPGFLAFEIDTQRHVALVTDF